MPVLLQELSFEELNDSPRYWRLEPLSLGPVNLLVGRNATGKSRTINIVHVLSQLLSGGQEKLFPSAHFDAKFNVDGTIYRYQLSIVDHIVTHEQLSTGRKKLLVRGEDGAGSIRAEQLDRRIRFLSPPKQLAAVAKQDAIQHPFLAPLAEWAASVLMLRFGGELGRSNMFLANIDFGNVDPKQTDHVIPIYAAGFTKFGEAFDQNIISDMRAIGYELSDIGVKPAEGIQINGKDANSLMNMFVTEVDIDADVGQLQMSQGMYRALSVIVQLNYSVMSERSMCMLIDDIGEGLDFERSTQLVNLIIDIFRLSNDQVIMSTNDRYVMNSVPRENWQVLSRNSHVVRSYNIHNSREIFEEFTFTGLSNFDMFATEFVETRASK